MPEEKTSWSLTRARRRLASRGRAATRAIGAGMVLLAIAGCSNQSEDDVRTRLNDWVSLGETLYFHADARCSAAVFDLKSTRISSAVSRARTFQSGENLLDRQEPVFFDIKGESPHSVTEALMSASLHRGVGLISPGISARKCMTETLQSYYLQALLDENADLVFDPEEKAMIVVDGENRWLFYARGDGK
ncbi:hypothetical protein GFB49_04325 [Epibacterium sp. SM1979]|uniref:Uncharacterized protein n=1 Tax=Tritonibacter litoralis TaxID=2662264 RepID=A0A843YDX7_9RHOB|nr:hypothetical protein [Tritonibacter litoralis]MQQ07674.1 hypothetical protein [Tritonibacter litoralis]